MKVAAIQTDIAWNDPELSVKAIGPIAEEAIGRGAKCLFFPEMFACGFSMVTGDAAKTVALVSSQLLEELAGTYGVLAAGSMPWAPDGNYDKPYNVCRVFGPAGLLGEYAKRQLFSYGGESLAYRRGEQVLSLSFEGMRFSFFICYDLRFPIPFNRLAETTDVFVVMANWPVTRQSHWTTLLSARAIENQAYVIGINRIGVGGGLSYAGGSVIVSPEGVEIAAIGDAAGAIVADLEAGEAGDLRSRFPVLKERVDV